MEALPSAFPTPAAQRQDHDLRQSAPEASLFQPADAAYHFHIDQPGDYRAVFQLSAKARETAEITHIVLADRLAGLPDQAIKSAQVLGQGAMARLKLAAERNSATR